MGCEDQGVAQTGIRYQMVGFGVIGAECCAAIYLIDDYANYMSPQKPIWYVILSHCVITDCTPTSFNLCFEHGRMCLRQGYHCDGGTRTVSVSYLGIGSGLDTADYDTSTVTPMPSNGCFDYDRGAFVKVTNQMAASIVSHSGISSGLDTADYPTCKVNPTPFNGCFHYSRDAFVKVTNLMAAQDLLWLTIESFFGTIVIFRDWILLATHLTPLP